MSKPGCLSILVVVDHAETREEIASSLRSEGFHVVSAMDAEEAVNRLPGIPRPALILVDLMTPHMNGWSIVEALDKEDRLATLPVALVAAADPTSPEGYRHIKTPVAIGSILSIVNQFCLRMG